jgi:hypothetical protein
LMPTPTGTATATAMSTLRRGEERTHRL